MNIGERIKQLIDRSDIEINKVAIALDMSPQNLYKIFKKDSCESKYLEKLSELLSVPIPYFFGEEGSTEPITRNKSIFFSDCEQELQKAKEKIIYLQDELLKAKDELMKRKD